MAWSITGRTSLDKHLDRRLQDYYVGCVIRAVHHCRIIVRHIPSVYRFDWHLWGLWIGMLVHPEMKENVRTLWNQPGQASQAVATQRLSYADHHQVAWTLTLLWFPMHAGCWSGKEVGACQRRWRDCLLNNQETQCYTSRVRMMHFDRRGAKWAQQFRHYVTR